METADRDQIELSAADALLELWDVVDYRCDAFDAAVPQRLSDTDAADGHRDGAGQLLRPTRQREIAAFEGRHVETPDAGVENVDSGVDQRAQDDAQLFGGFGDLRGEILLLVL